jgi:hypothetical protein
MKKIILSSLVLFTSFAHASQDAKTAWQTLQNQSANMQEVQINGVVASTEISKYLTPVIYLSDDADGRQYIACVLPRKESWSLDSYQKGQSLNVSGDYYGFLSGTIVLKNCQVKN